jgi:hypothetical protein
MPELNKNEYLEAIAQDLRDSLDRLGLTNTGRARESVRVRNKRNIIALGYVATLFRYVGRKPGKFVPRRALQEWILQRGIQFIDRRSGDPMSLSSMVFLINRKLARAGSRIFRDRRRGIRIQEIIEKNNKIYVPRMARELRNTYVKEFNRTIVT